MGRGRSFKVQSLLEGNMEGAEQPRPGHSGGSQDVGMPHNPTPSFTWPPCKIMVILTSLQGRAVVPYNRLTVAIVMASGQDYSLSSDEQKRQKAGPGAF